MTLDVKANLSLADLSELIRDPAVHKLIDECIVAGGPEPGVCIQDKLLDHLVEKLEKVEPVPLVDWLAQENADPEACRPCAIPVTLTWYVDLLKPAHPDLAAKLVETGTHTDPLTTARYMDKIKSEVEAGLGERLRELDATMQANVG